LGFALGAACNLKYKINRGERSPSICKITNYDGKKQVFVLKSP